MGIYLSLNVRRGVITCLPKGDKSRFFKKNWRPISLSSVIYKMASACIANRLKTVLPDIISEKQKGFMKSRFIGEKVLDSYMILYIKVNYITVLDYFS